MQKTYRKPIIYTIPYLEESMVLCSSEDYTNITVDFGEDQLEDGGEL